MIPTIRTASFWPSQPSHRPSEKKKLQNAIQIQYFLEANPSSQNTAVYAVNIFSKDEPYLWRVIPRYLSGIIRIMFWVQWAMAMCCEKEGRKDSLLASYILYMEILLDELWKAIDAGDVKSWEKVYGCKWVQIQKNGRGWHSNGYLEEALAHGIIEVKDLEKDVKDWDEEVKELEERGFHGREFYQTQARFDRLSDFDQEKIRKKIWKEILAEKKGKFIV
jgi:hypothetical protein